MIRPEAQATLWRWREALAALPLLALSARWITSTGLMPWLGGIALVLAAFLLITGLQRARFRSTTQGPGMVMADERELTYLGPLTGGSVALGQVSSVLYDPTAKPPHWQLTTPGEPPLSIPKGAEGSDQLFDALASLPGFPMERALSVIADPPHAPVILWRRRD